MAMSRSVKPPGTARTIGDAWPLAWRLLLPLAMLAVAFCGAVTLFLIRDVSARMDEEVDSRLGKLAETLLTSGLTLDPELLSRVRAVAGVEVTTVSPDGGVLASTLPPESAREQASHLRTKPGAGRVSLEGEHYRLVTLRASPAGRPGGFTLVVAAATRPTDRLKSGLAWTIFIATFTQLALLILIGHVVVKTATRPLARLARAARDVGRGVLETPVPSGGGREINVLAREFNVMVSELARSRQELVRAERLAVAGSMAASVAHEIRNPLSSIRMNIQLLLRRPFRAVEDERELKDLLGEVDRLDLVLGNLLDVAAPARFTPTLGALNPVVEETLRLTSRKLEHVNIVVETDLGRDLPEIRLDIHKLRQALLNVILNAVDAMPRGGVLRVATRGVGHHVELSLEDTGTGLRPGVVDRLFEPFFSTKPRGVGLGLYVVRNIIELHGAQIRLEPCIPQGTRCVMTFPVALETTHRRAGAEERQPA